MLKQLSLRVRLSIAFVILTIIVAALGFYQVQSINQVGRQFNDLVTNDFERRDILSTIKITAQQVENSALSHQAAKSSTSSDLAASETVFSELLKDYESHLEGEAGEAITPAMRTTLKDDGAAVLLTARQYTAAVDSKSLNQISLAYTSLENALTKLNQNIDDLIKSEKTYVQSEITQANDSTNRLLQIILLSLGGVAIFSALIGVMGVNALNRSLKRLQQGAQRIANGDFSKRLPVTSRDEIGQVSEAFNNMATRLRDSYQRLSIETERNKILLESLGEGVIAVDEKARIVLINEPAMTIFELENKEEVVGKPVKKTLAILDAKGKSLLPTKMPLVQALHTSSVVHDVYGFQRKADLKTIMIDITASPVIVEGETVAAIMNFRDVTKEREIDRMKTEFISLASHQLRTPLSAIRWFSEMLLNGDAGKLKPDQAEFARNISDSTDRMIALVNALLNISRIESGRIMIDPKPTDLRELVSGIINDLKAKTSEKQQSLIISVHEDLPKINLDPRLISQVYLNLLTNAIKYTPKGGEVSVFISKKDDQVISQVTDNGYGIPKEQQGRIFQKFFRATNATKVETDGTGLGLYLIKAVVESSGGKIWFESEEGKGTTFWFSIPLSGMRPKEGEVTLDV